ncbi:MAG: nickel pincer cofactor biosynthesis protein LarB [Candidatus Dadabacteria bacterium]|nr:MAG: nickel pincer cofactor biosynthesis protein LarB [Candidatus Dadabacteria bacterium]
MTREAIRDLLERLVRGELGTEEAVRRLETFRFEDLGFAKIDHHRRVRNGYPEVIYGEGKTPEQVAEIFGRLAAHNPNVLCTRANPAAADAVRQRMPEARYHELCRVVEVRRAEAEPVGLVALAAAGTSDLPVAEEAAVALEAFGSRVERVYDVGVAGIHRLFAHGEILRRAHCVVAVAGMEGALPSVVAGLVDVPVIAVPTSVGYGTSFGGITALLAMLNSCASGISVVNIDNGFGAAYQADMINKLAVRGRRGEETS